MNASVVVVPAKNCSASSTALRYQQQQQQQQCRKLSYGQLALNSILANNTNTNNNNSAAAMDVWEKGVKNKTALRHQSSSCERGRLMPKKSHSTTDLSQLKSKYVPLCFVIGKK